MTREELSAAAVKAINSHNNIAIEAATGSGKSKCAIDCITHLYLNKKISDRIAIVVAERAHIDTWKEQLQKWLNKELNITILCYASLHKLTNDYDLIVFDEAHHLTTEIRLDYFKNLNPKYRIFLSATLGKSFYNIMSQLIKIHTINLGVQEAIDSKIIAEPIINLIPLELNYKDITQIIVESWGDKNKQREIKCVYKDRWFYRAHRDEYPNVKLIIYCTELQKYNYLTEQIEYYKKLYSRKKSEAIKNIWLQKGNERKIYLGSLKTEKAKQLVSSLSKKRFICFCTNIEQADALGGKKYAIHSKTNAKKILEDFDSHKINKLFAVGMLTEGVNLDKIQVGVIVQLDGKERLFIQKLGRALRAKHPEQYIIYFKNTRDEEYLNNAIEGINEKYIKTITL